MRDDHGMSGGDGLFEIEPVEKKRPQGRPAAADKTFRAFDPHQVLLLPPSLDEWPLRTTWPGSSPTWSTTYSTSVRSWRTTPRSAATRPTIRG
jgi:hypothetical protein